MLRKPKPYETVLYSQIDSLESHAIRFIVATKDLDCKVLNIDYHQMPEELIAYNPTQTMPTLFDRNLIIYDMVVIMEYLDERFPFPQILPLDPIEKVEKRIFIYRFTRAKNNWYQLTYDILNKKTKPAKVKEARTLLVNNLIELIPLFEYMPYFKSETLGAVDICIAPVLWRLKSMNIDLGKNSNIIYNYCDRVFADESFQNSLTDSEKELKTITITL